MNPLKKLQEELQRLNDPNYQVKTVFQKAIEELKQIALGTKGEPGYTPRLGIDYYTAEDISKVLKYIESKIPAPIKGEKGDPGKRGETPIKGVDYFTPKERAAMIAEIQKGIVVKDGVSPKVEDVVKEVQKALAKVKPTEEFVTVKQLTDFLKRGGFRGGGGSSTSGGGMEIGGTITGATAGSTLFVGAGGVLAQDNANYFWDNTLKRLGLGTLSPQLALHVNSSDEAQLILSGTDNLVAETSGVDFRYFNGGANTNIARILAYTQSGGGGDLLFQTAASGASSYSTKVKINRAGQLIIDVNNGSNSSLTLTDGASYGEIQTFNSKPLYLNRQGNNIVLFGGTAGLLGINTTGPTHTVTLGSTSTGIALYNTADQTTNFERGRLYWNSSVLSLEAGAGGTGTVRNLMLSGGASATLQSSTNSRSIVVTGSGASGGIQFNGGSTSTAGAVGIYGSYNSSASSGVFTIHGVYGTLTQTGTAGYTALLVNPTEMTTGSGSKLLADLQVGGTSKFSVANTGKTVLSGSAEGAVPAAGAASTFLNITAGAQYGIIAGVLGSGKSYIQAQRIDASATTYNLQLQPNGGAVEVGSTIELGNVSDTTLSRLSAGTLAVEGVRVRTTTPLVVSAASYTTDTGSSLNMDNLDHFVITAQAGALLFNAPGGTLVQGRSLVIRIKDNGTARALTWNAVFRAMGTALPTTTVLGKTLYLGFFYNATDTKWDLVASAQEA